MPITKYIFNKGSKFIGLLLIINCLLSFSQPAKAEKTSDRNSLDRANQGLPIHRRDGGSRSSGLDSCVDNSSNLVALVPEDRVAATSSISPNLYFYIPETTKPKTLEFVLRNEADELVYEAFSTTNGKGVVEVNIPSQIKSLLKTEQNYRWYLSLICNPQQRARDLVVEGWMRQESMDSATIKQLSNTSDIIKKAEIYRQQNFWYDALSTLAKRRETSSDSSVVVTEWTNLLESVGLEKFAAEPFIKNTFTKNHLSNRLVP